MNNDEIRKLIDEGLLSTVLRTGAKYVAPAVAGVAAYLRNRSTTSTPQRQPAQPVQPKGPDFSKLPSMGDAGNIPQRTNNPGNITLSPKEDFAKSNARRMGATGEWRNPNNGRRYAVFPDATSGYRAVHSLITTKDYEDLTPRQAVNRYVSGNPNTNADAMYFQVLKQHGIDPDKGRFGDYDPMKRVQAISQAEGAYARRQRVNEDSSCGSETAGTTFKKNEVDKDKATSAGASRGSQKLGLGREMPLKGVIAPRLTREDVVNKTLDKYLPKDVAYSPPTLEEVLATKLEGLAENHALLLVGLFHRLNEENQYKMVTSLDETTINDMLDFALKNRGN